VKRVVGGLNRSGLRYMLTGALASSYYGRPRTTVDVDVVVVITRGQLRKLAGVLRQANLRVNERKLGDTLRSEYRILTLEDKNSPHTLDIIFAEGRLERKAGSMLGLRTFYQSPESLVLAKLRMIKVTIQPERAVIDKEDIKAILRSTKIRLKFVRKRAQRDSTSDVFEDLLQEISGSSSRP